MKQLLKMLIKRTPLYRPLRKWAKTRREKRELIEWEKRGKPVPPPHIVKQRALKSFAERFGLKILVETGTYYGDMVEAMKIYFDKIYSIELSKELHQQARARFGGESKIELIQGDSGIELANVIERIDQPALFWLDGHYSGGVTAKGDKETPIYEELTHIFNAQDRRHVIIIDDARCFGDDIIAFIRSKRPGAIVSIEDDSIRITPEESPNAFSI